MPIFCYQHHISDWRRDTAHLSLEQRGAYRELLDWFYFTDGNLPADMQSVCRLLGVQTQSERKAVAEVIRQFFIESNGLLSQKRCESEIAKIKNKSAAASEAAKIKALKYKERHSADAKRTHSERYANHESRTMNQEPITKDNPNGLSEKPPLPPQDDFEKIALGVWNETASQVLGKVLELSQKRRSSLGQRLSQLKKLFPDMPSPIEAWREYLRRILASDFLCGRSGRDFKATFDWCINASNFLKIMEGNYDNTRTAKKLTDHERAILSTFSREDG